MSENQKYTGNIGSVFQNIGNSIARFFKFKNKPATSRERNKPFFPPAGPYTGGQRLDTDKTMVFTENEIKTTQKKQNFADTMYMPGISDGKKGAPGSGPLFVPRTKRPNFVLGVILTSFKIGFVAIFVMAAVGFGLVLGLANAYLETTPELDVGKIQNQALSSYIYDQKGNLLATYTGNENRDWVTLDEIPVDLRNAFIAKEDIRFYSHNGVDVKRLVGALVSNLTSGGGGGGSTITQQLIKNSILTNERSYKRKLQEAYLSIQLEKKYTKDQILEAYLNTIPLGGTIYGVKTAAKEYFGKELSQLNLKEIACLAAITESTNQYNPYRATYVTGQVGNLQNQMNIVIQRMYAAGFITKEQYDATFVPKSVWDSPNFMDQWKSTMNVLKESPTNSLYPYPHFVEYVIENVETQFLRKLNMDDTPQNRAIIDSQIRQNGYKIYATIDPDIQNIVQTTISEWDNYPAFDNKSDNVKKIGDSEIIEPQASAVVIDNATGYIVALIGSRDTPTAAKTLNRAVDGFAPVGSSIKPLAVYGPAFDAGLSPATPIANVPVPIPGWDSKEGYPTTSQGTAGPVSIRQGIVSSLNIVAARTLMEYVGLNNSASYLEKLGMTNISVTGVGLALGQSGLTTLQMAGGYAAIANEGYYREPVAFTKVVDKNGNVVLDSKDYRKQSQVYKPSTAWMLVDVLSQAVREGTGRKAQIDGITVAGKTGTVVDNRGVFFAGMTGYYTSTLWVGHDDYKPFVSGVSALNSSAPLWQTYMSKIYEQKGLGEKPIINKTAEEEGLIKSSVDAIMGGAPIEGVPVNTDYFLNGTVPTKTSDIFKQANIDTSTGYIANPYCPPNVVKAGWVADFPEDNPYAVWMKTKAGVLNLGGVPIVNASQVCPIHTANWRSSVVYAQSQITAANAFLTEYAGLLTQQTVSDITATMQTVQNVINNPTSSDEAIVTSANILAGKIAAARNSAGTPPQPSQTPPPPSQTPPPPSASPSEPTQ